MAKKFYDEDDVDSYLQSEDDNQDDELETLSFGSLKNAQDKLDKLEVKERSKKGPSQRRIIEDLKKQRKEKGKEIVEESSDEGDFFDEDSEPESNKKKHKHAPKESSSKKPVKKIREIPGLETKKSTLFTDIRFDAALGKADMNRIRQDYKFLDQYREDEIKEIKKILKDSKLKSKLSNNEIKELEYEQKSLKSRLDSLRNRELQDKVLKEYKSNMNKNSTNKFYLKKSDERKIIQKYKFDHMKSRDREKVMERKRKRRLGKEFKQLEFNRPS